MPVFNKNFAGKYSHAHDARNDLGYGRVNPRFHVSRQRADTFPYIKPDYAADDVENEEVDEESIEAINDKISTLGVTTMDPYAVNKTNPFYFGAGNLKLSDCFERPDDILLEVEAVASSMYPMPHMYKGKKVMFNAPIGGVSGHSQTITNANPLRTGTTQGWSHAPVEYVDPEFNEEEAILSLEDLVDLVTRED
jgi:hypothetical protein